MPHILIEHIVVLVPALPLTTRAVEMAVAMGMHTVSRSQETGQRPTDRTTGEDLPKFRQARQTGTMITFSA